MAPIYGTKTFKRASAANELEMKAADQQQQYQIYVVEPHMSLEKTVDLLSWKLVTLGKEVRRSQLANHKIYGDRLKGLNAYNNLLQE